MFASPGDPPLSNGNGFGSYPADAACVPDTVNGCKSVRDLYELAGDTVGFGGRGGQGAGGCCLWWLHPILLPSPQG